MKVCWYDAGHMTNMAAMPLYGKHLQKFSYSNQRVDFHETWYVASGTTVHYSLFK